MNPTHSVFSLRPISHRSGRVIHGISLGLFAFAFSYVSVFLLAVFYRLDYPWLLDADGLLVPQFSRSGYYIPGAGEMIQSHMLLAATVLGLGSPFDASLFEEIFPIAALLPGVLLLIAGAVLGYLHRRKSLYSNARLSAWLVAGYVLPIAVLSAGSLLVTFRGYDYSYGFGLAIVFSPTIQGVVLIILYAIGLALLCGTMGIVLSGRMFDTEPHETPAT